MTNKIGREMWLDKEEGYITNMLSLKDMSECNLKIITEHDRYNKLKGLKVNSRRCYLQFLINLCRYVNKPLMEVTKNDLEEYVLHISEKYTAYSVEWRKATLKVFFKWLYKTDEYPEMVKWINPKSIKSSKCFPEHILSKDEVIRIANATGTLKYKALVLVLYESACRISELCTVRVKDVKFDSYGALMGVDGKTGERQIRLIESSPILKEWINNHHDNKNPDAPLFYSEAYCNTGKMLRRHTIYKTLKICAKRAGIKKEVWPHLLRHSRLTEMAKKGYQESFLKKFAGWTGGSNMPQIYINLSGKDIDDVMLNNEGLKVIENEKLTKLSVKCQRCGEENSATNRFCGKCSTCLDDTSMKEIEAENMIKKVIMNNPDIMRMMEASMRR